MRERLEYWGVRSALAVSRLIPRGVLYRLSRFVVERSFGPANRRRHARILEHIAVAFPGLSEAEREKIAERYRWHKAHFFVEILLMLTGRFDYESAVVNLAGARKRIESLKARNERGMVFLVSHYGNWEFLAQFFAINGLPGTLVAKENRKNSLIDERIVQPYRRSFGHRVIERKGALRAIAKILKNREGVGMHIDQMIPPPNGVLIDFFGTPAYASKSMAQLKLRFDPLMVPIFAVREGRERFRIIIGEPEEYRAEEFETSEEKIRAMTQRYSDLLIGQIRRDPAQWEWYYRRWRRPEKEAQSAGR
jgi:KDO2-lipid IV(A) lauroyltransferase